MSAHTDLIKLAHRNGGRIPSQIPAHYVSWARATHIAAKRARHAAAGA